MTKQIPLTSNFGLHGAITNPSSDGTYNLQAVKSGDTVSFQWGTSSGSGGTSPTQYIQSIGVNSSNQLTYTKYNNGTTTTSTYTPTANFSAGYQEVTGSSATVSMSNNYMVVHITATSNSVTITLPTATAGQMIEIISSINHYISLSGTVMDESSSSIQSGIVLQNYNHVKLIGKDGGSSGVVWKIFSLETVA